MLAHIPTMLLGCIVSIAYTSVSISYTRVLSAYSSLSIAFTLRVYLQITLDYHMLHGIIAYYAML